MDETKRTKTEERNYTRLMIEMEELESWNRTRKLKEAHLPEGWRAIAREAHLMQKKVPVTLRVDEDVAKWFRSQGQGHQSRMNRVLKTYMLALISKEIRAAEDIDWKGDPI